MNLVRTGISSCVYKFCGIVVAENLTSFMKGSNNDVSLPKLYYADSHFWCLYLLYDTFLKEKYCYCILSLDLRYLYVRVSVFIFIIFFPTNILSSFVLQNLTLNFCLH